MQKANKKSEHILLSHLFRQTIMIICQYIRLFQVKILQLQQEMMMNSPTSLINKNKSLQLSCGCGKIFKQKTQFKQHSLFVHNGQFQNGSTHYLTKFTILVLPILHTQTSNNIIPTNHQPHKIMATTQSTKNNNKRKSQKMITEQNMQQSIQTIQKNEKKIILKQKTIEWNGFRLALNKVCKRKSYYCGNCQIQFSEPQSFITHCIEICQQLKNKKSSHFIGCIYDIQKSINLSKQKQANMNQTVQTKEKRKTSIKPKPQATENIEQRDTFVQIGRKNLDHRRIPFFCGVCNQTISLTRYRYHMASIHSQIIQPTSSHIILRTSKRFNVYLSPRVQWINQDAKYYCSCKPLIKMTMSKLIKHVFEVHKGISPRYS